MNSISENTETAGRGGARRSAVTPRLRDLAVGAVGALVALAGCIQGPWDYYPEDIPVFKGIWATGYAVADRPLEDLCFEKFHTLGEESTDAFAFYDSARVTLSGRFRDSSGTLTLSPRPDRPNCFRGDSGSVILRGEGYALDARLVWDSAGATVASVLKATAQVPDSFSINRTALAPKLAETGGVPSNILSLQFINSLSPAVQEVVAREYGDTLLKLQGDSVALRKYLETNGREISGRLFGLLQEEVYTYSEGDSVYYLNGNLNTLSHYFTSRRSGDVGGVLISHRFDSTMGRPETAFNGVLGLEPDSSEFFFPGDTRRLIAYPNARGPDGWEILDSMGVVNVWFFTGRNRLYFYGVEEAYMSFLATAVEGEQDSRITPKYNVEGGRGIFAGAIRDSFELYVRADSLTKVYSLPEVRANVCGGLGWDTLPECRNFYREHCRKRGWAGDDCRADAVRAKLEAALKPDTVLLAEVATAEALARQDAPSLARGTSRFCAENGFPGETCGEPRRDCVESPGRNACKETLWDYCKDSRWRPAQCGNALAWYCRDNPRLSDVLCKRADLYCADAAHAGEKACQK